MIYLIRPNNIEAWLYVFTHFSFAHNTTVFVHYITLIFILYVSSPLILFVIFLYACYIFLTFACVLFSVAYHVYTWHFSPVVTFIVNTISVCLSVCLLFTFYTPPPLFGITKCTLTTPGGGGMYIYAVSVSQRGSVISEQDRVMAVERACMGRMKHIPLQSE